MLKIDIHGCESLCLSHLVLDYNGTIAVDGKIISGVGERLDLLSEHLCVHVVTADTFGSVQSELSDITCQVYIIPRENQAQAKADYVGKLGCDRAVCIGNGRNDVLMLEISALAIAVIQSEGSSIQSVLAADIVTTSVLDALDLLIHPLRLAATLRT